MLQTVLAALPKLTPEEIEQVRQRIQMLSAISAEPDVDDWLLKGIITVLEERGLGESVPFRFRVTNRRQHHGYMSKSEKVRRLFESRLKLTQLDKVALGQILARSLASYVEEFRTVTLTALLQHVDLVIPALDAAFPGYLQAGMIMVLVKGFPRAAGTVR